MGDRKFIGLWVAVFVAVVLVVSGSKAWADGVKPDRILDTFQLGETGCEAVIVYKNGQIQKAITRPIYPSDPVSCNQDVTNLAKPIQNFVVCDPNSYADCRVLDGVDQTVVEENTGSCIYPVNTRTGQRLVIPLPGC